MWTSNARDSEYNTQIICPYVYTPDYCLLVDATACACIGIYPGGRRDLAAVYRHEEQKVVLYKLSNT